MTDLHDQIAEAVATLADLVPPATLQLLTERIVELVGPVERRLGDYRDAAIYEKDRADAEARAAAGLREDLRQARPAWHVGQEIQGNPREGVWRDGFIADLDLAAIVLHENDQYLTVGTQHIRPRAEFHDGVLSARRAVGQDVVSPTSKVPQSNECGCPGSGTHAHVRGCRLQPDGAKP